MTKNHAGRRGHGILRDTLNTGVESLDGLWFALGTASRRIWIWRLRVTGLETELMDLKIGSSEPQPWLWGERSMKVESVAVSLGLLINALVRAGPWAYVVAGVTWVAFFLAEAHNTAQEWLIDTYQAKMHQSGAHDLFVKLVKHTASGPVLLINLAGGLAWVVYVVYAITS